MFRNPQLLVQLVVISISVCRSFTAPGQGRIIDGIPAKEGQWPFMVSLLFQGRQHFCGASIINDDTIMTAAHCAYALKSQPHPISPSDVVVYVGHVHREPVNQAYLYQAKEVIVNEVFARNAHFSNEWKLDFPKGHDVALIKLEKKIAFEKGKVDKVCLPAHDAVPIHEKCVVMGWGYTQQGSGEATVDLMQTTLPILSQCDSLGVFVYDKPTLFCAGGGATHHDSCQGDSGGPLVCPHKGDPKEYLQFGIVSFGDGCGNGGFYSNVSGLLSWIQPKAEAESKP